MKYVLSLLIALTLPYLSYSQNQNIYNPEADATSDIKKAIELAQQTNKHVFLQIGGNWCPWCIKFHNFVKADATLQSYLDDNYVVVKVNYDRKNKQEELLTKLEFPQRFGFPVFVILNAKGKRIHTQNSAFLERDKNYDPDLVLRFFKNWSPTAVNPNSYKKQP